MARSKTTFRKGHVGYKSMLGMVCEKSPVWKGGKSRCLTCGKEIGYSSKTCNKHKVFTEEHKKNISRACKGRVSPNKGKTLTAEHRKKIGQRRYPIQEKHPNWRGGETKKNYGGLFTKKLKNTIRNRDDNVCQVCDIKQAICDIHHIDYNKNNNKESNLVCLCRSCHSKTNFHRTYWALFFLRKKIKNCICKASNTWALISNF